MSDSFTSNTIIPWTATVLAPNGNILLPGVAASTEKLEISASVNSLYIFGEWIFSTSPVTTAGGVPIQAQAIGNLIEAGLISVGTTIEFNFAPTDGVPTILDLGVLAILNGPGPDAISLAPSYRIILISTWYFAQVIGSHAYQGSVSSIIIDMMNSEVIGVSPNSTLIWGETIDSKDNPMFTHYRTMMTPGKFMEERLIMYVKGNEGTPTFVYSNIDDRFEIMDYHRLASLPSYTAIDPSHPDLPNYQDIFNDPTQSTSMILTIGMILDYNKGKRELWALSSPSSVFMYHIYGAVKEGPDDPVLVPLSTIDPQKWEYITNTKDPNAITKVYLDDSLHDYEEIATEASYEYAKALMDSRSFTLVCLPNLNVKIGRACSLHITNRNESTASLFFQDYLISEVSQLFVGLRCHTHITLTAPTQIYTSLSDVAGYFNRNDH